MNILTSKIAPSSPRPLVPLHLAQHHYDQSPIAFVSTVCKATTLELPKLENSKEQDGYALSQDHSIPRDHVSCMEPGATPSRP